VSFRFRDGSQLNGVPVESAVATLVDWVRRRENTSPGVDVFRAPGGVPAAAR
jgi:threonyl-tRNA synthetase